jgi:hypothetical protein
MKARPYRIVSGGYAECERGDATHVALHFPGGPFPNRMIPVILKGTRAGTGRWSWNGDTERPTLKPSILTWGGSVDTDRCHTFVNDGMVQFLSDCSHGLAGQTLDLLDVE